MKRSGRESEKKKRNYIQNNLKSDNREEILQRRTITHSMVKEFRGSMPHLKGVFNYR